MEDRNNGDGKRGKYLEKEKMFFVEEKKENIMETLHWRGKNYCEQVDGRTDGSKAQKEVLTDLKRSFGKVENPFNHKKDNSSCTF